ncbi:MAG: bifunctional aspartate kinase/diaminopimelate decarboxylase [Pseudomonadota bacterium]
MRLTDMTREASFDLSSTTLSQPSPDGNWVVLKFGGSSVATYSNWLSILARLRRRQQDGFQLLVVHSALRGVSDQLQALLASAEQGLEDGIVDAIVETHEALAADFGVDATAAIGAYIEELRQLVAGVRLVRELTPRVAARVMAMGELMATSLSAVWLRNQGLDVVWHDARTLLRSQPEAREKRRFLNAVCRDDANADLVRQLSMSAVNLTQGFIASDDNGETVLLGRGGSDTSAAYFAAGLSARRLEIWTDVPGMFSADPRLVPSARLLTRLHYSEAQEIASTGGLVLHPRCIGPIRRHNIPMFIRCTPRPELPGTLVAAVTGEPEPTVKAISMRQNLTLLSLDGVTMWQEVGFLARVFAVFAGHRVSIDLVSTSESNVTVSIDDDGEPLHETALQQLVDELSKICVVRVIHDCASVSLVGRKIRTILHKLGPALELFEEQRIHLVSQAANDLNLTFVVDDAQGYRLIQKLHPSIIRQSPGDTSIGDTWESLQSGDDEQPVTAPPWWRLRREELLESMQGHSSRYVYDGATIASAIDGLKSLAHIDRVFFAMKANSNIEILKQVHAAGLGFECVSPGELDRVLSLFPDINRDRLLFTPNFAPREDYERGFETGATVTLDNLFPLRAWPDVFKDRDIFIRVDPGQGRGHHEHVRTAGMHSKFGVPLFELEAFAEVADALNCRVVGVHAHSGSGITQSDTWRQVAEVLADAAQRFPHVRVLDLGGGLGVAEKPGDPELDLAALDDSLAALRAQFPDYDLWLEPGRYLVAKAGVLLARVTQTKGKGDMQYVGIATGMNSLIRPALYGAYHEVVNLTRLDRVASELVSIVGPICETGDKLASDRLLPPSQEGDVLLIANTGAYGRAMASTYNLRDPAPELLLNS